MNDMEKKGYRIEEFEQALPAGAEIDEVRYKAKGGQRVNYVIGTVRVADSSSAIRGHQPAMVGMRTVMVTWDEDGLCRRRRNNERMPEFDIKLDRLWT